MRNIFNTSIVLLGMCRGAFRSIVFTHLSVDSVYHTHTHTHSRGWEWWPWLSKRKHINLGVISTWSLAGSRELRGGFTWMAFVSRWPPPCSESGSPPEGISPWTWPPPRVSSLSGRGRRERKEEGERQGDVKGARSGVWVSLVRSLSIRHHNSKETPCLIIAAALYSV